MNETLAELIAAVNNGGSVFLARNEIGNVIDGSDYLYFEINPSFQYPGLYELKPFTSTSAAKFLGRIKSKRKEKTSIENGSKPPRPGSRPRGRPAKNKSD